MASILIVEDEKLVAKDLQLSLRDAGHDPYAIASSSDEALRSLELRVPELVLMDIRIRGDLDGIETSKILHHRFGLPVIYLTAHGDSATLERAKVTQPYGYVLKPYNLADLCRTVELAVYRHAFQREREERERWYSTTLRSIGEAVITVDNQARINFLNPCAEEALGMRSEACLGRPAAEVLRLEDEQETPLETVLRQGQSLIFEGKVRNGHDQVRIFSDTTSPVVTDDRRTLGAVMVFRDITERQRLQRQIEFNDRLASLGTMAAGMAHEINNPLAVIQGHAEWLEESLRQKGSRAHAQELEALIELKAAVTRIRGVVNDLRTFSQPPREERLSRCDVRQALERALRSTCAEIRRVATLVTELNAERAEVEADENRLVQVLVNLLINAAQAIDSGSAGENRVEVKLESHQGLVEVLVSDTGTGIPPEAIERIFDPFYTTKPPGVGTGLGLSVCHTIVRTLGGELSVDSELGQGTTFRLQIPLAPTPPDETEAEVEFIHSGRILVIDDDATIRKILSRLLSRDHRVTCASQGQEALNLLDSGQEFEVILCDLMMPVMDGREFFLTLQQRYPQWVERVIFLSGGASDEVHQEFVDSLLQPFLHKPLPIEHLREMIQIALTNQASRASTP